MTLAFEDQDPIRSIGTSSLMNDEEYPYYTPPTFNFSKESKESLFVTEKFPEEGRKTGDFWRNAEWSVLHSSYTKAKGDTGVQIVQVS